MMMNGSPGDIVEQPSVNTEPAEAVVPHNYVSAGQKDLIDKLVYFQNEFEQRHDKDVSWVLETSMANENLREQRLRRRTEISMINVHLIGDFAKRLPGFDKLQHEDKLILVEASSREVMILKTVRLLRKCDYQADNIMFANNQPYSRGSCTLTDIGNLDDLLHFGRLMYSLKVDNAEYALLTAIIIFADRPNVINKRKVQKIQDKYVGVLKAYVESRRKPNGSAVFAKLLSVLTEIRTFANQQKVTNKK